MPTPKKATNPEPDDIEDDESDLPDDAATDLRVKNLMKAALKEFADENKPAPKRTNPPEGNNIFSSLFGR